MATSDLGRALDFVKDSDANCVNAYSCHRHEGAEMRFRAATPDAPIHAGLEIGAPLSTRVGGSGVTRRGTGWVRTSIRAVDKVVAQVSQPAVSQGFQPAGAANLRAPLNARRAAD